MLEEIALPYEAHLVRFDADDQKSPEFRTLNPYGKIPAIIDPNGPDGEPLDGMVYWDDPTGPGVGLPAYAASVPPSKPSS